MTTHPDTFRYDDRMPRLSSLATIFRAVAVMALGVVTAALLFLPGPNVGPWLTFGRIRPVHPNGMIFGVCLDLVFAGAYHSMQPLLRTRTWTMGLARFRRFPPSECRASRPGSSIVGGAHGREASMDDRRIRCGMAALVAWTAFQLAACDAGTGPDDTRAESQEADCGCPIPGDEDAMAPADVPTDMAVPEVSQDAPAVDVAPGDAVAPDAPLADDAASDPAGVDVHPPDSPPPQDLPGDDVPPDVAAQDLAAPDTSPQDAAPVDPGLPAPVLGVVSPASLLAELQNKDFLLINVHIPNAGQIPGTDRHISYQDIDAIATYLGADLGVKAVVYCLSNYMSTIAGNALVERGYRNIRYLDGGMGAWKTAGYPFEAP